MGDDTMRSARCITPGIALAVALSTGGSAALAQGKKPGGGAPTPAQLNPAIAFVAAKGSRQDVFVAAADRADEIALTKSLQPRRGGYLNMGSPAWSPDGAFVAFWVQDWLSSTDAKMRLYAARADGS